MLQSMGLQRAGHDWVTEQQQVSRRASQVALVVENLPINAGDLRDTCLILGWEDPLEQEMATHSSILAWKIPCTEEPRRLQSMGLQRVRYN